MVNPYVFYNGRGRAVLMPPSTSDPYVYLSLLYSPSRIPGNGMEEKIKKERHRTANIAKSLFMARFGNPEKDMEAIQTASMFLQGAINLERSSERSFIENKLSQLKEFDGPQTNEIKALLSQIQSGNFNTTQLILALNYAIMGIDETRARIEALAKPSKHNNMARGQLNSSAALVRQMRNEFEPPKNNEATLAEVIRVLTFRTLNENLSRIIEVIGKNLDLDSLASNLSSAAILVQQLIYDYLLSNSDELDAAMGQLSAEGVRGIADKVWKKFTKSSIYKNISSSGNPFFDRNFQNAINATRDFFHVTIDDQVNRRRVNKNVPGEVAFNEIFQNSVFNSGTQANEVKKRMKRIKIKTSFQLNQRGNYMEIIRSLVDGAINSYNVGRKGGGTDTFLIGAYDINIDVPKFEEMQNNYGTELLSALGSNYTFQEENRNLDEITQKLSRLYNAFSEMRKGFIIHESDKDYTTIMTDTRNKFNGFKGRVFGIDDYIDRIASLGVASGATVNWLKFAAINLSSYSIGGPRVRVALESYFAIFAGLLMFDDFDIVAQRIINQAPPNNIDTLHLYNLNGIYVPTSYFLQATYERIQKMATMIESNDSFIARVSTPDLNIDRSASNWGAPSYWENLRDTAYKGGTVAITFAAKFLNLIDELFSFGR